MIVCKGDELFYKPVHGERPFALRTDWEHEPTRGRAALLRRRHYCSQPAERRSPTSRFMESLHFWDTFIW